MKYQSVIQEYGDNSSSKGLILKLKPGEFDKYSTSHPVAGCQSFEFDASDDNAAIRYLEKNFKPADRRPLSGRAYVRSGRPKFRNRLSREERVYLEKTGTKPTVIPKPTASESRLPDSDGKVLKALPVSVDLLTQPGVEYEIKFMNIPVIFVRDRRKDSR